VTIIDKRKMFKKIKPLAHGTPIIEVNPDGIKKFHDLTFGKNTVKTNPMKATVNAAQKANNILAEHPLIETIKSSRDGCLKFSLWITTGLAHPTRIALLLNISSTGTMMDPKRSTWRSGFKVIRPSLSCSVSPHLYAENACAYSWQQIDKIIIKTKIIFTAIEGVCWV